MAVVRKGIIKQKKESDVEKKTTCKPPFKTNKNKSIISEFKKEIAPQEESISIGLEYQIPEGEEFVAVITGFSTKDTGILMHLTIFAEEKCNKTFYYKTNTSAIAQLRKFASMFEAFDGELGSIVGECAIVVLSTTDYGFQYVRGVSSVTEKEANEILSETGFNYDLDGCIDDTSTNRRKQTSEEVESEEETLAEEDFEEDEDSEDELDYEEEDY